MSEILYTKNGNIRKNKVYTLPKFKKMASVNYSERKQGYIFYTCKNFVTVLSDEEQSRFIKLCERCSCGHTDALFEYLVCDVSVEKKVKKYNVSRTRLYVYVSDFYNNFEYIKNI